MQGGASPAADTHPRTSSSTQRPLSCLSHWHSLCSRDGISGHQEQKSRLKTAAGQSPACHHCWQGQSARLLPSCRGGAAASRWCAGSRPDSRTAALWGAAQHPEVPGHPGQERVSVARRDENHRNVVTGDSGRTGPECSTSHPKGRLPKQAEAPFSPAELRACLSTLMLGAPVAPSYPPLNTQRPVSVHSLTPTDQLMSSSKPGPRVLPLLSQDALLC